MAKRREQLHEMVLDHVAHLPSLVVIAGTGFQADRLGHRDLDVVDVAAGPGALEQRVGEAQHQEVLDRFLAEIMVDPVGAVLRQDARDGVVDLARRGEIAAQRLFKDDARGRRQDVGGGEILANRDEEVRRRREVERAHAAIVAERRLERLVGLRLHRIEQHDGQALLEVMDMIRGEPLLLQPLGDLLGQPIDILLLSDDAEDAALTRQDTFAAALGQGRKQLAQGEITARAEDHQVESRNRRALGNGFGPQDAAGNIVHRSVISVPVRESGAASIWTAGLRRE